MSKELTPAYRYGARVRRWVDGDTVLVDVDLGFRLSAAAELRLTGIDTPERGRAGYSQARDRVNQLAPPGLALVIQTYSDPEKWGRYLADVFLPDGRSVAAVLLAEGLGVPYNGGTKPQG